MARLSDDDLRTILGPDFARKLKADLEHREPTSPEERAAHAKREANKLADFRFTLWAVIVGGSALMAGSYFNKTGIDLPAVSGALAVAAAVAGLFFVTAKRKRILADPALAAA